MANSFPATAGDLTDEFVLRKCDYFTSVHLWPLRTEVNARLWLQNFEDHEKRHAHYLLNSFVYMADHIVQRLVVATYQSLSCIVAAPFASPSDSRARWREFADAVLVVPVSGEVPRPTDSGYTFARFARDDLDVPESRILEASKALEVLTSDPSRPVLFLDDFLGSGNQFIETWRRQHSVGGHQITFESLAAGGASGPFFYCPVVATGYGANRVVTECSPVVVRAGHVLSERYSVFHSESLTWPDDLRSGVYDFVRDVSERAGIPDTAGGEDDWRGFHKLGLAIGFAHGVPDATIPLFWWESETWNPLKRR